MEHYYKVRGIWRGLGLLLSIPFLPETSRLCSKLSWQFWTQSRFSSVPSDCQSGQLSPGHITVGKTSSTKPQHVGVVGRTCSRHRVRRSSCARFLPMTSTSWSIYFSSVYSFSFFFSFFSPAEGCFNAWLRLEVTLNIFKTEISCHLLFGTSIMELI